MLSSDTKWDDLNMFKLEVSALSEGPMVTRGSPFLEISIEKLFCEVQIPVVPHKAEAEVSKIGNL